MLLVMNDKLKKILIVVLVIVGFIVLLRLLSYKSPQEKIDKYITGKGFSKESNSTLYYKKISKLSREEFNSDRDSGIDSEYEMLYFNIDTYQLLKDKLSYSSEIDSSFNPTYDYTNNKLTYDYRVVMNETNIIIKGDYNMETEEFTCERVFASQVDMKSVQETLCNKIKYDVEEFKYEALTLIDNSRILNVMKKK